MHLHLSGPALIWFKQLGKITTLSWTSVKAAFQDQYMSQSSLNPGLIIKSASFENYWKRSTWRTSSASIWRKAKNQGKPERDLINKFIDALPPQLAFCVRVGRCANFSDAPNHAKTGKACRYS